MPVEAPDRLLDLPTGHQLLWCSVCGTEFRYLLGSDWVTVIYPGCVSKQ
jgi:hypothetical protein